ncbi:transposase [Streptomyces sp. NPDC056121]|uniref:transposase n=1 Tax=unclassified Streptomyces TaxID=2593676 RepID=UPI0035DB0192
MQVMQHVGTRGGRRRGGRVGVWGGRRFARVQAGAVAPYEWRPGATIRSVAADLGIDPEALRNWAQAAERVGPEYAGRKDTTCFPRVASSPDRADSHARGCQSRRARRSAGP